MALKEVFASFGIKVDDEQLKRADKGVSDFIGKLGEMGRALVGGVAAVGFFNFAKNLADTGDALNDAANRLGLSSDALQSLGFAAQMSGSNVEGLTTALLILNDKVGDALINSAGEGAKTFQKYGISLKDASGQAKSSEELFSDIADKIADTTNEQKQLTIAVDFFSKQGRALLPMLKEGADGIAELTERAAELGEGFSKEAVEASAEFNDSLDEFGRIIQTVRGRLATALLPLLRRVVDVAVSLGAGFLSLAKNSAIFEGALAALAAVLTVKLAPAFLSLLKTLLPFAIPLAIITAIALVVDDLITMFRGGKSVIGEFIDSMAGIGTTEKIVRSLKQTFDDLFQGIRDGFELIRLFSKSKGGFRLDLLNTDELLKLNGIARRADERAGTTGNGTKGFLPLMANGRGAAIRNFANEAAQLTNPTVPASLSRAFVSQAGVKPGTTITAPTNVTVTLNGGGATESDRLLLQTFLEDLLDKKAQDVKAALVPAVPR
jgi:hypothetical protein